MSDQERISPYNFNIQQTSGENIEKISLRRLPDPVPNSLKSHDKNCIVIVI